MVPDIEGDCGYPQVPQLTEAEESVLKDWTVKTMKTQWSRQISDTHKRRKR